MTDQRTRLPSGATAREQASDWFAQRQAIADNPLLRQRFEQWRAAAPEHAGAYAELENLWQSQTFEQALQALAVDLELPPAPLNKRPVQRRWLATAAALLLMLGVGWIGDVPMRLQADHLTATAEIQRLLMPDGSQIVLGSHSAISTQFDGTQRRINLLRGELYVEAAHDSARPMVIDTGEAQVTVVGTRFSVSKNASGVTVAVREGRVRLANREGADSLLQAGNWQQLQQGHLQALHTEGSERQLAWLNGRLSFQDRPLAQVLDELQRYYPAPIVLLNERAAQQNVSGSYQLDDPQAVVQALARVTASQLTRLPGGALLIR